MISEQLVQSIIIEGLNVAQGKQDRLLVENLSAIIPGTTEITRRDLIKMIFAEFGVEVEFSGRNEHEKGVVIDVDEARVNELGLSHQVLKQGQTLIRLGPDGVKRVGLPIACDPRSEGLIKETVANILLQIRSNIK